MSLRFWDFVELFQRDSKGDEHEGPSQLFEIEADSASAALGSAAYLGWSCLDGLGEPFG